MTPVAGGLEARSQGGARPDDAPVTATTRMAGDRSVRAVSQAPRRQADGHAEGAGDPRHMIDIARRLEDAGDDGVVVYRPRLIGPRRDLTRGAVRYRRRRRVEPLTIIHGHRAATERLLLTTGILIVPLRPAPLLAKNDRHPRRAGAGTLRARCRNGWQPRSSRPRASTRRKGRM